MLKERMNEKRKSCRRVFKNLARYVKRSLLITLMVVPSTDSSYDLIPCESERGGTATSHPVQLNVKSS